MQDLQISIGDSKFQVQLFREGRGEPLLFIHGELGHPGTADNFLKLLSNRFTVYAPVHPGFGRSQGIEEIDDVQDMAFHYFDLLDALGLEQPFIVGHSLGGMLAAEMATLCAHRIKKLILVAPLGLWRDDLPIPDIFILSRRELREVLFADRLSEVALKTIPDEFPSREAEMEHYQGLSASGKLLWGLPYNPKLQKRLHRIKVPTLIIWGEGDRLVDSSYGELFAEKIKGSRKVIVQGCSHMPHLEAPEELARLVEEFFEAAS